MTIREVFEGIRARVSDMVFAGRNRSMITIGTDRKNTRDSGYGDGGENDPDSSVVDIVAGFDPERTDPDLPNDKSRIYVAEKTDPDDYFSISVGESVEGEPAIVGISDNVYFKARNKIKILNGEVSISIDSGGNIEIESSSKAEIKVGGSKIEISESGEISLNAGQGISGNVLTDLDQSVHIDPITGGQVFANFQRPAIVSNSKVKVK